jgi:hypothetical protein
LRDTPPAPLSPGVKAALWVAGGIVSALLVLTLLFRHHRPARPRPQGAGRVGAISAPAGRWVVVSEQTPHPNPLPEDGARGPDGSGLLFSGPLAPSSGRGLG